MPLHVIRADITTLECDAIVNAANTTLLGGGGVDGAIHKAAGPKLLDECRTLHGCKTGEAKITGGYNLPAKYVIHTAGPVWNGGNDGEEHLLRSCYRNSLNLAVKNGCESVAFPLISSGVYGYPKADALDVAVSEISGFLFTHDDLTVYIVVFDKLGFEISQTLYKEIQAYIDQNYVEASEIRFSRGYERELQAKYALEKICCEPEPLQKELCSLDDVPYFVLDEGFSDMLLRKIDEKGMTDPECYKKANVDRKLFSKIKSNKNYKPSKNTVLAFAIGLELSIEETDEMLMKAGFALSNSSLFDVIVGYFIENKKYNIFEINEALFKYDQCTL